MLFDNARFYELENRIRILNLQVMIVGNSNGNDIAMDTCNKLIKLAEDSTALEIGNFGKSSSSQCPQNAKPRQKKNQQFLCV